MKSLLKFKRPQQPFLAPLGSRSLIRKTLDRLPPAAAPVAVTLVGGLVLFMGLASYLGRDAGAPPADGPPAIVSQEAPPPEQPATLMDIAAEKGDREADMAMTTAPAVNASDTAAEADLPSVKNAAPAPSSLDFDEAAGRPAPPKDAPDPAPTAAIPPALPGVSSFAPVVPVAETEDEITTLEAIQRREVEADIGAPSDEATSAIPPAAGPMRAAIAAKYVNMRAGPDDDAEILLVVPALAEIEAETGCNWCAVTYDGRSGYIYKTFISYAEDDAAAE